MAASLASEMVLLTDVGYREKLYFSCCSQNAKLRVAPTVNGVVLTLVLTLAGLVVAESSHDGFEVQPKLGTSQQTGNAYPSNLRGINNERYRKN